VLAVVASHASIGVPGGYVGVDVFFVISGFLITRQLLDEAARQGRFSFARFYARRVRRILPAATLVTIATMLGAYLWAPPLRLAAIARDGVAATLFSINWRLAARGINYFQASAPPSPFQHYWSLSVEEQFYLGWPLLLAVVLFSFRNSRRARAPLVSVLVLLVGASLWASVHVTNSSAPYGYFGTQTRVWELATGALIAATAGNLRQVPRVAAAVLAWFGLAAILTSCFVYSPATLYPGFAAALPVAGAALLICAGCGDSPPRGPERILKVWPMRWTGRISYSLYLWHWPLLILAPDALGHPLSIAERLFAIGAAFALSALTYVAVEQPFQRRGRLVAKPRRALLLGTELVVAAAVIVVIVASSVTVPGGRSAATSTLVPVRAKDVAASLANPPDPVVETAALRSALSQAAQQNTLPDAVTPSLPRASSDYPNSGGCELDDLATTPKLPCDSFGDPEGTKLVVLLGDSHAGMWLGAMKAIAVANHWRLAFFAKSGCPLGAYPDYVNPSLKRTYTECNTWRTAVIAHVVALHPALVVVGSQARPIAAAEPAGLQSSIEALEASGSKVAFLADTPSPAAIGSVPDCLSEHPKNLDRCDLSRATAVSSLAGRQAEIDGARRAGAVVVDPTSWFCATTVCPAVVQGVVVYEDDSHITNTYAMLRAPDLAYPLTTALG
jgi:peptidoglycan/LPS O-acetylase OafA/YrhL